MNDISPAGHFRSLLKGYAICEPNGPIDEFQLLFHSCILVDFCDVLPILEINLKSYEIYIQTLKNDDIARRDLGLAFSVFEGLCLLADHCGVTLYLYPYAFDKEDEGENAVAEWSEKLEKNMPCMVSVIIKVTIGIDCLQYTEQQQSH